MLYQSLQNTIKSLDISTITDQRKKALQPLIDVIKSKIACSEDINLNFICTHNSRRSHLSQVWAQTMAMFYNVNKVFCYSGGTEATALFPVVADTFRCSGFMIDKLSDQNNPIYSIKFGENSLPIIGFSKLYDAPFNPVSNFAAILTCSSADADCPYISGADTRIPITYEDPKAFDNTAEQAEKYMERSNEIATEMKYVFSNTSI